MIKMHLESEVEIAIFLLGICLLCYIISMTATIMLIRLDQANILHERNPLMKVMFVRIGLMPTAFIGTILFLLVLVLTYVYLKRPVIIEFLTLSSIYLAFNDTRWYLRLRRTNTYKDKV